MSAEEREAFLAGLHVGVLSVADDGGAGPWLAPIWYAYEPGGVVRMITLRRSRKTRLARTAGRASLCVQTEAPPYRYVTVEGPVVGLDEPVDTEERRAIAQRYLGVEMGNAYIAATASTEADEIVLSLRPERWLSADYSRMGR
jgi:nitroimidazol reductase NimA-like FMN-containing flavoprotein (pyridoxamine 5'-phosphate oxidase superfamily)